tara:strand:+ start:997 stop:1203 length:207 start_codon:yes stop_codon:yes gene_type:complete
MIGNCLTGNEEMTYTPAWTQHASWVMQAQVLFDTARLNIAFLDSPDLFIILLSGSLVTSLVSLSLSLL